MPGRPVTMRPPGGRPRSGSGRLLVAAAVVLLLGTGMAIGVHLAPRRPPSRPLVTVSKAPQAGAAQVPGRRATVQAVHRRTLAVAAAVRSITAFSGPVLLEPERLRAVVAGIVSRASRGALTQAFLEASAQTRSKLGADTVPRPVILLRAVPLGYRFERYSAFETTIAVWYVGIVGSGATVPPQQSWRTQTIKLVWEDHTWKVTSFASIPGPTPALSAAESEAPGELFEAIPRFSEFGLGLR
jgi:hypothetical protein